MLDPIRNIIVPTDFSDSAESAIARAVDLAQLDGATVHLLHAMGAPLIFVAYDVSAPTAVWEGMQRGARERLETVRKAVEEAGVECVTTSVSPSGDISRAIQAAVEEHDADLVVMGAHGYSGVKHALLGSVTERTFRTVDGPVLAVKGDTVSAAEPWKRIVVATDFSNHSEVAVEAAGTLARRFDAALEVLHSIELPKAYVPYAWSAGFGIDLDERIRESAMKKLSTIQGKLEKSGLSVTVHARTGHAAKVVPEFAKETACDLVVMGTRGNSGLSHLLLGSVAESTLRHAPCSVLTVTAKEPIEKA